MLDNNQKYVKRRHYIQRMKQNIVRNWGLFLVLFGILLLGSVWIFSITSNNDDNDEDINRLRRRGSSSSTGSTDLFHTTRHNQLHSIPMQHPPRVANNGGSQQQQQQFVTPTTIPSMNTIPNEEEKIPFLFVHINKTGGTSLIRMFEERCEEEYYGDTWYDENEDFHRSFHATAHAYIEYYGRETWNDAYTFAVVRHPLARQVSNFFFLAQKGCRGNADKCEERLIPTIDDLGSMTDQEKIDVFHEWILNIYHSFPPGSTEHYRFGAAGHGNEVYDTFSSTQTSWLVDPMDGVTIGVKDIFKLETLSNDMSRLAKNIPCLKNNNNGPASLEMDHSNKTPTYPDYMLFAKNKETRRIINEVFAAAV